MSFKWTILIALFAASPLGAQWDTTGFDTGKTVTLQGVVTKTEWSNPHVMLHMDVKDDQGKMVSWLVSIAPPNVLKRTGVTPDSIKEGAEVSVEVFVAIDGSRNAIDGSRNAMGAGSLTLPDGRKFGFQPGVGYTLTPQTPAAK
jgi:hypothetical protein